ncbi:MAG: Tex family protein, partial [Myxococcota bacterium]
QILQQPHQGDPMRQAQQFVHPDKGVDDAEAALAGAKDIVAEVLSESPEARTWVRTQLHRNGHVASSVVRGKADEDSPYRDYFDFQESVRAIPSHRYLALCRGEREKVLRVKLALDTDTAIARLLTIMGHKPRSPYAGLMEEAVSDGFKRLLLPGVTTTVRSALKERADARAIAIFAENLRNLLLAAPAGSRPVIGVDPGLRTGCKCAVLDNTGRFIEHQTLYLVGSKANQERARDTLLALVRRHKPFAMVVGNGTGGREAEGFIRAALRKEGLGDVVVMSVNEAGASVYSASEVARAEFPELDLTIRGAISIGRRFQDPLAELVKIDPKSIGVGQYQHDVSQSALQQTLDQVVESCVNRVGVALNTASAPLLSHVAGIGPTLAQRIVEHRQTHGPFNNRRELLKVSGLGPKTFEQAAGFTRLPDGEHPLDASAVHPERYTLVERMARDLGLPLQQLVGNAIRADRIPTAPYVEGDVGEPTVRDIIAELKKPGRDPRDTFEPPKFRDDVHSLEDLEPGMTFQGVVTNVVAFGAFVDIGVHQDGLVHISELADRFVKDPHTVVKVGQTIQVKVMEVDLRRRRIALTARGV